ncbi:hypothetical protein [Pseudomonas aeruginosa]|uniref:hypothetical protein n=1 Tax=Pseudomonas aeruginosa TaxID=287 RepID=UPI001C9DBD35|nr:hypothetical protein [Pseudomonas aeruginosa]MBY9935361.1 hypothetical protein [Pseudomonas aeruginosa]MBY9949043.1 hypothetical protein [Pseudomonas aeruginosa]MBY9955519.1 hypothetical protein [Pseudomonas aeruginosa]QZV26182.1 hypothetical protein ITG67_14070 [Pseudomonas aeruginosa]WOE59180.1 hypothetical protein PA12_gene3866 [Pseudomonas aeruginosa]
MGGRITVESVVRCSWNGWPDDREIRKLDEEELSDRATMIELLAQALAPFSRTYVIGEDTDDNAMTMEESIRVVMQPSGRGNRARHVTDEVLEEHEKLQEFA